MEKIKELKEKINRLQNLVEDFLDSNDAKKSKIVNLEIKIEEIKRNVNGHLDDLEQLIDKK